MLVIVFRSKLTPVAGEDYNWWSDEMNALARQNPGFVDVRSYVAADGERLTLVWWRDEESRRQWSTHVRHLEAKKIGRAKWYEYYKMDVAQIIRVSEFSRQEESQSQSASVTAD